MSEFKLSVILPRYREDVSIIRKALEDLQELNSEIKFQVIIVNDGIPIDGLRDIQNGYMNVLVLQNRKNIGKARSIARGIERAKGKFIFYSDIDLPVEIKSLSSRLSASSVKPIRLVVGRRVKIGTRQANIYRRLTSIAFSRMFRLLITPKIQDSQCPWKLIEIDLARELFTSLRTTGFAFDAELIHLALRKAEPVEEISIDWEDTRASWGLLKTIFVFLKMTIALVKIAALTRSD